MGKLYNCTKVAELIGVTPETIRNWEQAGYIPESSRIGLQRKRVWGEWKVQRILEFARDNGYLAKDISV